MDKRFYYTSAYDIYVLLRICLVGRWNELAMITTNNHKEKLINEPPPTPEIIVFFFFRREIILYKHMV